MEAQLKRHEPLYLKHRPQALDQLVGQESVRTTLTNAINFDRISHAYLFTGPRGTGKTSSARILAKSLNCKAGDKATATPCQECSSCLEIRGGNSPAVFEIDAASNNSVDDARVLIERAPLVAPGGRYKIYIIDECHMLTKEAFNALLKTIEDPPPNVVFILATTEEHKVLPTIVSRCQRLMFRLVQQEDLLLHLRNVATQENIEITDRAIDFIARRSGGGLRDALGLLDQASLLSAPGKPVDINDLLTLLGALNEDVLLEMSACVLERKGQELLAAANKLLHQGREPAIVVQELARHFLSLTKASYLHDCPDRDNVATKLIVGSPDYVNALYEQAPKFERSELSQIVEILDRLEQTCRRTTQPGMHLEVGLLGICHRQDMLLVRELSSRVARLEQALAGGAPIAVQPSAASTRASAAPAATSYAAPAAGQNTSYAPSPQPPQPQQRSQSPSYETAPATARPYHPAETPSPADSSAQQPDRNASFSGRSSAPSTPPSSSTPTSAPASSGTGGGAPAPTASSSAPAGADEDEDTGDSLPPDEVDRIWEEVLTEVQRIHIPTHGVIMSAQGFPLRISDSEVVIAVKSELLHKNLEGRIEHVKKACANVMGKSIHVKVRVVNREPAPAARPAAAPRERAMAPAPVAAGAPGPDADEDYDRGSPSYGHRATTAEAPIHGTDLPPDIPRYPGSDGSPASPDSFNTRAEGSSSANFNSREPGTAASASNNSSLATATAAPPANYEKLPVSAAELAAETKNANTTIIKEAYKLFEGPGSRLLGGK